MPAHPTLLIIFDGYGIADDPSVSAVDRATKPFIDGLFARYPHTKLTASGEAVGLPDGQFGNSEVGHTNLGAGRIVYQELTRINKSIRDGDFFENAALVEAVDRAKTTGRALHLLGLVSNGGVHAQLEHLIALLELCQRRGLTERVFIHAITDGRDTDPHGGGTFLRELQSAIGRIGVGRIATVCGRYYAMDRDKRWERTKLAFDLLTAGIGSAVADPMTALRSAYEAGTTDEFIEPIVVTEGDRPVATLSSGDSLIFFNFRGDRARQILRALFDPAFAGFEREPLTDVLTVTFTEYQADLPGVSAVAFPPVALTNVLGEWFESHHKTQLRIAETEKYPHVTYFFNGGREAPFEGEERVMVPSPKVATYDLQPEMSAVEITDRLLPLVEARRFDFICLNYANPDMVGHTGVMAAAIRAVETVEACAARLVPAALAADYAVLILADHGNADRMRNPDGTPHTAHTTAPVPLLVALPGDESTGLTLRPDGILADIAPTILHLMGLEQPAEMTGRSLIEAAPSEGR